MTAEPDAVPLPPGLRVGVPAAVFLLSFLCFTPALDGAFLNWDDNIVLTDHDDWRGLGWDQVRTAFVQLRAGHYHPLTWLSYGLDYSLWGMNPRGYHLVNLLLHATTATLFYAILVFLLERTGAFAGRQALSRISAAAGALFFAIHPLRVESVAWITERRDMLSGCFLVLTVLLWLRWTAGGTRRWYWAAVATFLLSLLSKAWGITLPAVLLILDVYPLGRWTALNRKQILLEKLPFVGLAVAAGGVAFIAQRAAGAMSVIAGHTMFDRLVQSGYGLAFYVFKTIAPGSLNPLYALKSSFDPMDPPYIGGAIAAVALTVALIAVRRRRPDLLAAWAVFVVSVSPVLGIAQAGPQLVAERYTYLACLPFAALVAAGLAAIMRRPNFGIRGPLAVAGVVLAILGYQAWKYSHDWRDSISLWTVGIRRDPDNAQAWFNLGSEKLNQQRKEEAFEDLSRAIQLIPTYAPAYINRGNARLPGDPAGAIADYDAVLKMYPDHIDAYANRGVAKIAKKEHAAGLADLDQALKMNPNHPRALVNRGLARMQEGNLKGAREDLDRAVKVKPGEADGWYIRALTKEAQGDYPGALEDVRHALSIAPRGPRGWMHAERAEDLLSRLRRR